MNSYVLKVMSLKLTYGLICVVLAPPAAVFRTLQWDTDPSALQLQADSELGRRMHRLGASKIVQIDFLPKELVTYTKETQTPSAAHQAEGNEY
uniref:Dynein cytoplasmic 1 intermediate chain 1b n=1 Tax=Hucho hucho TaxID=62062 RepID=A0A4W5JMD6_9TELE